MHVVGTPGMDPAASLRLSARFHLSAFRDFDQDGFADLLSWTANERRCDSNSLRILGNTQNPAAPLDPAVSMALPPTANPFCIGPEPIGFNSDGRCDIILTNMPDKPGALSIWPSGVCRYDGNRQIVV